MWGDLGKLIAAKGFKKLPKSNNLPNLVTLTTTYRLRAFSHNHQIMMPPSHVSQKYEPFQLK